MTKEPVGFCISRSGCRSTEQCRTAGRCLIDELDRGSVVSEVLSSKTSDVWPELDAFEQEEMRHKARPRIASKVEAYGHMSDEWVANRARMLYRDDLEHEAICSAARDRIMRLSIQLAEARGIIAALKTRPSAETPVVHQAMHGHFWTVEELRDGRWSRSAVGHAWALEKDAREQCEELRRRYGGRIYRVSEYGAAAKAGDSPP